MIAEETKKMTAEQMAQRVLTVRKVLLDVMNGGATFNAADVTNIVCVGLSMALDETDAQHYCRLEYDGTLRKMHDQMDRL